MHLTWKPNFSVSALHAAEAIANRKAVVDERVLNALREPAEEIATLFVSHQGWSAIRFWDVLIGYASEIDNNRDLAQRTLVRVLGSQCDGNHPLVTRLAGCITDIEAAFALLFPKLIDQLELRSRPLREQWEARGPGLMAHVGRLTERELLVDQAEVILTQPILGGGGAAHLQSNRVRIEAVLTNPLQELPEVIRLGWLLSQLNLDLPVHSEPIHAARLIPIAGLAMLPPILAAGNVVELTRIDEPTLTLAIEQWQVPVPPQIDIVASLMSWWETYLQERPAWRIALVALDKMLNA